MKIKQVIRVCTGAVLVFGAVASSATVLTFQEGTTGYTGTLTTEISSGQPDSTSPGSGGTARASVDTFNSSGTPDRAETQALIVFNGIFGGSGVPVSGVTINGASLRFWTKSFSPGAVGIYQMLTTWDSSATWNNLGGDGIAGDISSAADDSKTNLTDEALVTFDVTSSVTAWAGGATNYGWGLMNASNDGWDFNTELYNGTASNLLRRPVLSIDYSLNTVPEPASLFLLGLGLAGFGFSKRKAA